jgi:hypothetical protein
MKRTLYVKQAGVYIFFLNIIILIQDARDRVRSYHLSTSCYETNVEVIGSG